MPSSPNYVRDYKQEALAESPARREQRNERKAARRQVEKTLGHKIPEGYDVNHITPLSKGGSNKPGNIDLRKSGPNHSYPRTKTGAMK